MDPELDLSRLTELQELLGARIAEIVDTLLAEFSSAFAAMDRALAAGDLPELALAAHAARNSALMIDARTVLGRLGELEASARLRDVPAAVAARDQLRDAWPALRRRLELAAARDG